MKQILLMAAFLIIKGSLVLAQQATISGQVTNLTDGDTVLLTTNDVGEPFSSNNIYYKAAISRKAFSFKIQANKTPVHISIGYIARNNDDRHATNKLNRLALDNYYVEAGDNIYISEANEKYTFRGRGAAKFRVINALNALQKRIYAGVKWGDPSDAKRYFLKHDTLLMKRIRLIRSARNSLSENIFYLLQADVSGDYLGRGEFLNSLLPKSLMSIAKENLNGYKNIVPKTFLNFQELNRHDVTKLSGNYSLGVFTRYKFDSCTYVNKSFSLNKCYNFLNDHYPGAVRQRLLLSVIYLNKDSGNDLYPLVSAVTSLIDYTPFKNILNSLKSNRLAGAEAFPFNLPDTSGQIHSFNEYKGKVVLLDFWFTGCGICLQSAPLLKKIEERFKDEPFVVITVSLDNKLKVWKETIKTHRYTSANTVDLYTEDKNFNHPIAKYYFIDGCPTFILIDKAGNLMGSSGNPVADNGAQLSSMISKALKE